MPPRVIRQVELCVERLALDAGVGIEAAEFREKFRELFDRAALAAQRVGLDLDDVVFERALTFRTGSGIEFDVDDPPLSDQGRLAERIAQVSVALPEQGDPAGFRAVELRVTVWRESPLP